ncbi:MarR family winged helix-turn-helix transcriptional regulator [Streptacidiphilus cavernicola]|uniref:MarR family winged helix-turn-helix transcriptional regulator n=1 Tax=Streptacidiphilus cavernicola TaxID=3342716 RepID=A0ABV6VX23_9ACTN
MREPQPAPDLVDVDEVVDAMVTASRVLVAVSARSLAAIEEALTVPQFRMLVVLDSGGPTNLTGLAEQLAVNPSTALRMVDRLTAAGMVARDHDPADRRVVLLTATAAGRQVVRQVTDRRQAEITRIVSTMPAESRGPMVAALRAFARAAGEEPVAPGSGGSGSAGGSGTRPGSDSGLGLPGWT